MEGVFAVQAVMGLIDNITGPLRSVGRELDATEGKVLRLSQRMGMLAKAMLPVAAVAGLLLLGLGGMASRAVAFESAMADVNKILNLSNAEFRDMGNEVLGLSSRIPMAAEGIAAIIESAGQSGVAKADLLGFAEQAAQMGVAFGMAGDQAGKTMSDWRAGMGLTLPRVYALADAVNHLSNNMNATAPALSELLQRSGALAMQTGLTEQGVAALGAAFLSAGASPEIASTALANFTGALVAGTAMTDRQAEAFRSLGFSATQLASDMQRDAQGTIMSVLEAVAAMPKELQLSISTEIFGKESLKAIAPLLANTDLLRQAFSLVGDQVSYAGSMQAEYDTRSKTVGNTLMLLGNKLGAIGIVVGTALLPAVGATAQALGVLADGLLALAQTPAGQILIELTGILAAGVVAITAFAAASWAASAALPLLGGALAAVSWPIWLIIAAIGALYLAWKTNFGGMAERMRVWWNTVSLVGRGVWAVLSSVKDGAGEIRGELAQEIEAAGLTGIVTTVARLAWRIRELGVGIWQGISSVAASTWAIVGPILEGLGAAVATVAGWLGLLTSATAEAGAAWDLSTWNAIGQVLGSVLATIAVGYGIVMTFRAAQLALVVATKLWAAAQWLLNTAFLASPIGWVVLGIAALAGVAALIYAYWELIAGFFGRIFGAIGTAFGGLWDALGSIGSRMYEAGAALISTLWEGIKSQAAGLYDNFRELLGPLGDMLPHSDAKTGPLSTLTASGAAIPQTLGQGVESAAPRLAATVAGALGGLAIAGGAPAPALAEAPAAPEIRVEAPAPARSGQQQARQIIIQRLEVKLDGVKDADDFLAQLARLVEAHGG